ncbi:MAG: DEAD/DEAH box helicase [Chitinivibrionales bacterium]|nr:DEAD/DEAH box helicase [Chitinivibrionales bacterium]
MAQQSYSKRLDFLSPLSSIPGFGPKRFAACKESGLETIGTLLYHFPLRYIDRSVITPLAAVHKFRDSQCSVIGTVTRTRVEKGRKPRLRILVEDDSGAIEALWFHGIPYLRAMLHTGKRLMLTGKIGCYGKFQMVHPDIEVMGKDKTAPDVPYLPIYSISMAMRSATINQKTLFKVIKWVLKNLKHYPQILPAMIEQEKGFPSLQECLTQIHMPDDPDLLDRFRDRIKYEELYQLALSLRWSKRKFAQPGRSMKAGGLMSRIEDTLPFTLTDEQRRAVSILHKDSAVDVRMHRLLQGDVGSGKTVVAFCACLPALNEGCQVAWLAPTEVLATQTHTTLTTFLRPLGIKPSLLKGGTASSQKRKIIAGLKNGEVRFVVGTHALLQPSVAFAKLGMIVIDEQHRFGVRQRLTLQEKDPASDFLLMSATPIPQTLAKTLYGDLDIVSLNHLPVEKKPVRTHVVPEKKRMEMERFAREHIESGKGQVFYIAPRIEGDYAGEEGVGDVTSLFEKLTGGTFKSIPVGLLHGRMAIEDKERVMEQFVMGEIKLLVSTTVVEVGIDIPSASIMIIENAEQFGLSQLHQLRGRVGRDGRDAYCFLLASFEKESVAEERLNHFCSDHDGFSIAERDLKLRGPGEVIGIRQSGWDELTMADIVRDAPLFREIQEKLDMLLER